MKNLSKEEVKGFGFGIAAAFSYSVMVTFVKLSTDVNSETLVFFRNLICALLLLPIMIKTRVSLKTNKGGLLALRTFVGLIALYSSFYAAKTLQLVDATLLINTAPLFIPLVVLVWQRLQVPKRRLFAVVLGFVGVFIILKPQGVFLALGGIAGLTAGLFMAIALVTVRKLSKTEPLERIMVYFFLSSVVITFFPMIFSWQPITSAVSWGFLIAVGLFSFLYQYCITKAYTHAPATKVSTVAYLTVAFSGFWDWVLWNDLPDATSWIGLILIVGGGLFALLDKQQPKLLTSKGFWVKKIRRKKKP